MKGTAIKKTWFLLLIVSFFAIWGVVGCQQATNPHQEGGANPSGSGNQDRSFSTLYDLDRIFDIPPIKIRLINVGVVTNTLYQEGEDIQRGHLALGLEIANTSSETVWFFPERFNIVLNTGEKLTADISISSDIGGSFPERRIKKGFLLFPIINSAPEHITELLIQMSAPLDENHQPLGEDQELVVTLQ